MMVHHNYSPVVFLVVIVLVLVLFLGLLLGGTEIFNPTRAAQEAFAAATSNALHGEIQRGNAAATLTPLAISLQATAVPPQLTATRVMGLARLEQAQTETTLTRMAKEEEMHQAEEIATRTALEREAEVRQSEAWVRRYQPFFVAALGLSLTALIAYAVVAPIRTRAKEAEARVLAERRRLLIVQQSLVQRDTPVSASRVAYGRQAAANGDDGRKPTMTPPKQPPRPTA